MVAIVTRQDPASRVGHSKVAQNAEAFQHALQVRRPAAQVRHVDPERTTVAARHHMGYGDGRYPDQQDRAFWGTSSHIADARTARELLCRAVKDIGDATQHYIEGGSTLSAAILTPDHKLTTLQIGDSPLGYVLVNRRTGKADLRDLTEDQSPDAPAELARIKRRGGKVEHGRQVNGNADLALARSFGDREFVGITAKPTIQTLDLNQVLANPDIDVFVFCASDGLIECNDTKDFEAEFKPGDKSADIARRCIDRALKSAEKAGVKKGDNISVSIARLKRDSKVATYIGVADGHGENAAEVAATVRSGIHHALHARETESGTSRRHHASARPRLAAPEQLAAAATSAGEQTTGVTG
jgi:serine/threonine protein phosphatase PrpC